VAYAGTEDEYYTLPTGSRTGLSGSLYTAWQKHNVTSASAQHTRDARNTGIRKIRGIKSDGIIYRGLAKYFPQHST